VKRNTLAQVVYFGKAKTDKFSVIFFGRMWGYSVVADLLRAKRNQLEITKRGDGALRLKLTKMEPRIKQTCNKDQVQRSHLTM